MGGMDDATPNEETVFQIPDLRAPSKYFNEVEPSSYLFSARLKTQDNREILKPLEQDNQIFFNLPQFPPRLNFNSIAVPNIVSTTSIDSGAVQEDGSDDIDLLLFAEQIHSNSINYKSWDSIDNILHGQYSTPYITEADSRIFDAAVEGPNEFLDLENKGYTLIDYEIFCSSLRAVGLGRKSFLFTWDDQRDEFIQVISKLRISGLTGETLAGLTATFLECGNYTKSLQNLVHKCYSQEKSPTRIALACSTSTVLRTLQSYLDENSSKNISLIHLQSLFKPVHAVLLCFHQLMIHTATNQSDEFLLSALFEDIQVIEHRTNSLRDVLLQTLVRVSQPWLKFISELLGLKPETYLSNLMKNDKINHVRSEDNEITPENQLRGTQRDYQLEPDRFPSFIDPEDARNITEVGKNLRLLSAHHPNHPLARTDIISAMNPPHLNWGFSFHDIIEIEAKALSYENDVKNALKELSNNPLTTSALKYKIHEKDVIRSSLSSLETSGIDMKAQIIASMSLLSQPPSDLAARDDLSIHLRIYLSNDAWVRKPERDELFAPPISLVPALCFNPIIAAQARIVHRTCLKILFNSHQLRNHLSLQRNFQLFGNGVFSSRLIHAISNLGLCNTNSDSTVDLRFNDKKSYLSASSELQLTLEGILSECFMDRQSLSKLERVDSSTQKFPPDNFSFTIREISNGKAKECVDPDSIEALDFLRLSYQPPAPLDTVITPLILHKYGILFKFLLRIIRVIYTVSSLFAKSFDRIPCQQNILHLVQRFRFEAHHFVCSISSYFFDTGIAASWENFEAKLDQIEILVNKDEDSYQGQEESLEKLREYHERVLDRIMFVLLLRKHQQPILSLLEEIFGLILQLSKWVREKHLLYLENDSDNSINDIYLSFRKKVKIFITVLRGLKEKKGYGERKVIESKDKLSRNMLAGNEIVEENTVKQLLIRLEISDYYEEKPKAMEAVN